ncbi:MAG: DUF488 family protein [Bryobacteraceae bacterium]|nr:DUF488 family protein [Bryobacteraceae bacterium]
MIRVKRIHQSPGSDDGVRLLVDRLWPRGLKKDQLRLDSWLRDAAPSDALRRWFHHSPGRWETFRDRYFAELDRRPDTWKPILKVAQSGTVTLLYAARDTEHNNAVALRDYLMGQIRQRKRA